MAIYQLVTLHTVAKYLAIKGLNNSYIWRETTAVLPRSSSCASVLPQNASCTSAVLLVMAKSLSFPVTAGGSNRSSKHNYYLWKTFICSKQKVFGAFHIASLSSNTMTNNGLQQGHSTGDPRARSSPPGVVKLNKFLHLALSTCHNKFDPS